MKEALKLALEALEDPVLLNGVNNAKFFISQALAQPTSGDYALGYAEGFNDACKPKPAQEPTGMLHIDRLDKWLDASLKERKAQPAQQEPWCMKMNGCKTKCEDCPVEVVEQEPVNAWLIFDKDNEPLIVSSDLVTTKKYKEAGRRVEQLAYYTTPPQRTWVGLTEARAKEIWLNGKDYGDDWLDVLALARAFESELKEKNT